MDYLDENKSLHWPDFPLGRPRKVTFHSAVFKSPEGEETNFSITMMMQNGDAWGIIEAVKAEGGIGAMVEGVYRYIPWPCASVIVEDM